jgi:hypothetical protein
VKESLSESENEVPLRLVLSVSELLKLARTYGKPPADHHHSRHLHLFELPLSTRKLLPIIDMLIMVRPVWLLSSEYLVNFAP